MRKTKHFLRTGLRKKHRGHKKRLFCCMTLFKREKKRDNCWIKIKRFFNKKRFMVNSKKLGSQSGFSLLEILVVVVIIGILAAIGLSSYQRSQMRSRDAKRKSEASQLSNALEMFYQDKGQYPPSAGGLLDLTTWSGGVLNWGDPFIDPLNTSTVYMAKLPVDGVYYESVEEKGYILYSYLENEEDEDVVGYYQRDCGGRTCNLAFSSLNVPQPTPMPESEPTSTPAPTATPAPTSTPAPTNTPAPTAVPTVTPIPTPACAYAPTDQDCNIDGECVDCYGAGYQCSWNSCQPSHCELFAYDMYCDTDAECIECYGSTARCVANECGVPTGGGIGPE